MLVAHKELVSHKNAASTEAVKLIITILSALVRSKLSNAQAATPTPVAHHYYPQRENINQTLCYPIPQTQAHGVSFTDL